MSESRPPAPRAAFHHDPTVTIPATLSHGDTHRPWRIRHGLAKLQRKYSQFLDSREFDGYVAARTAADSSWRHRVEMPDLLMTRLMQSQIDRRPGTIEAVLERRREIEAALAKVPDDLALEQDISEGTWQLLESLFEAFRVKGVALAIMTKVLWMKRPALIPMLDSHVMGFLFAKEWPLVEGRRIAQDVTAGVVAMKQFRELMLHQTNYEALTAIRDHLAPSLGGLETSSRATPVPSLVRLLDNLLWYDWNGYKYFGDIEDGLSISDLIVRLRSADHAVRWRAAERLGVLGAVACEASDFLSEVVNDEGEDSLVGSWARDALDKIASSGAVTL